MTECEKCIRAQDQRDPIGARHRAKVRALMAAMGSKLPVWDLPDDDEFAMTCIDCPACGGHWLVTKGEQWCAKCAYELGQVERHSGPPVETGYRIGELVRWGHTVGRVSYIDPSGFIDIVSGGWSMRVDDPRELDREPVA